ncbi:helix-turn-helix domain-containing protein [Tenggerimyces flavus]|uniref:Helix-turn-helix domain-containing protein n=1 Tax=Tenggerimyces flavus TaxID=1708749 RepID=A0ABV7YSH4_9ACTN|nr:helix-turn-helix transcriptional regulator [Tenggerimyces flavus]MBM7790139.1 transcriptional regulator with XRE-family HTH domain [Tenggerimyces flavus]
MCHSARFFDAGLSQTQIAALAGISQSQVSRLVNGQNREPGMRTVGALAAGLGIPRHIVGLADDDRSEDNTYRRQFLAGALGTASAAALPARGQIGDEELLRVSTLTYRRLEQHTPSASLLAVVTAHLALARSMLEPATGGQRTRLLAALAEIAGLAGWLCADRNDAPGARSHYQMAVRASRTAGHPLLASYMQGSLGQYAFSAGDPAQGLRLIRDADARLPRSAPAIARAWLACLEGVALAHLGDRTALALVDHAERHLDAGAHQEPAWPWVFRFDASKVAAHRAVIASRLGLPAVASAAFDRAASPTSPKQAALTSVEYARALAAGGDLEQACEVAATAYDTGRKFGSERVRVAVRDLRAQLGAVSIPAAAALDDRLMTSYTDA